MRFKMTLFFCLIALPALAADFDLKVQTALQTENGGDLAFDDRAGRSLTAFHVAPTLVGAWSGHKLATDVRLSPSMDVPSHTSGAFNSLTGEWRIKYAHTWRTLLETRFHLGQIGFDETTRWRRRVRWSADFGLSRTLTPSFYLLGGYTYALSNYFADPPSNNQSRFPQLGAGSIVPDEPILNRAVAAGGVDRKDHRHRLRGSLLWVGSNLWGTGGVSLEDNRASELTYDYRGVQISLGGGVQKGALGLNVQTSHEWRTYRANGDDSSRWRSLWVFAETTYQLKPWLQAFAGIQKEYGYQNGRQAFEPWSLVSAGLKMSFPLKAQKKAAKPTRRPAGPHPTEAGWVFRYRNASARSVHLIGTFSNWRADGYALTRLPGSDVWEIAVKLKPGIYEYAFIVDGEDWVPPPQAALYVDDGFGNRNGVLVVDDEAELTAR